LQALCGGNCDLCYEESREKLAEDMTFQIAVLLALIGGALVFFVFDWVCG